MDTCRDGMQSILVKGCCAWNCQVKGGRGRPKTRFMDVVRENMRVVGVSDRDTASRRNWRLRIRCGDP